MTKHNAGPWESYFTVHGDPSVVTDANRPAFTKICDVSTAPSDYGQSNCRLIAAAPEMLEALKSAMQCLEDFVGDGPTYRIVKAAIVKAEGKLSVCDKCGDVLTGHEDDSATRCRWCVTSQPSESTSVAQAEE